VASACGAANSATAAAIPAAQAYRKCVIRLSTHPYE
jgi:hypothetical protein